MKRTYGMVSLWVAFLALSAFAFGPDLSFEATLDGAQEFPAVETDTTGEFEIEFNDALSEAEFDLDVFDGEDVTVAHLHCGRPGQNGPAIFFLFEADPGEDVDGELSSGTLTNADYTGADCAAAIGRPVNNIASLALAAWDGLIYANVHTTANTGGEVRGQLLLADGDGDDGGDDDHDDDGDEDSDDGDDEDHDDEGSDSRHKRGKRNR